ncbi:hypothetical protein DL96DRAFT_1573923 [Flagelloscypha sp. PMI_526]|nr:hypothetical protein DL96DRAFT_1573923 [Flagelloscypha sp. PMI_526]
MASTQHYIWAGGHFLLLLAAFRYLAVSLLLRPISPVWYKAAFTGALTSYAIVCQKSLGPPSPNFVYLRRAIMDENVQYLLVALFWWTSKPVAIALIPYAIFSLFHALTFTRTTLMPKFLPPGPPNSNGAPTPHPIAKKLQTWVKANYDRAMKAVAYAELVILARVVFGAFLLQNSLLTPVVYVHFLRQRWYQSAFTREAVIAVYTKIDGFVRQPGKPPVLLTVWSKATALVQRWAGPGTAAAPGPAAARQ